MYGKSGRGFLVFFVIISATPNIEGNTGVLDAYGLTRVKRITTRADCSRDTFTCKNQKHQQCVPLSSLCDGVPDCQDGSDESGQYCKVINTGLCTEPTNETESCHEQIPPYAVPREEDEFVVPEVKTHSFLCSWVPFPKHGSNVPLICERGVWIPADMSKCSRVCQKISSSAVSIECHRHGKPIPCKAPLLSGTRIRSFCPPEYTPNFEEVTCGPDGEWDHDNIECIPECGKLYRNATEYTRKMRPADYREFPWNVALFGKVYLLCPATIITPYMVLTVATCVFQLTGKELEVVVAKKTSAQDQVDDDLQQSYKVKKIHLTEKEWDGHDLRFTDNIAILELTERIKINEAVYPACLNWNKNESLIPEDGVEGMVSSWQVKVGQKNFERNDNLQTAPMKMHSRPSCLDIIPPEDVKFVRVDSFCVENSEPPTPLQPGASWVFRENNTDLNFVQGVMSNGDSDNVTVFTDAVYHMDWINKVRKSIEKRLFLTDVVISTKLRPTDIVCKSSILSTLETTTKSLNFNPDEIRETDAVEYTEGCSLPERDALKADYEVHCPPSDFDSDCGKANESAVVPLFTTLTLTCEKGYTLDSEREVVCLKDRWRPTPAPCIRTCKPLSPINAFIKCYLQEQVIDCKGILRAGTRVTPECIAEYEPEIVPDYRDLFCQDDGEWSASLYKCVPKCGVPAAQNLTALIHGGRQAEFGEFPWHVAVYDITTKDKNLICGGTIITPYLILSAAHCFYTDQTNQKKNVENYVIAVGKVSRDYEKTDSEFTKFYDLENILFNRYEGKKLKYRSDIAFLVTRVKIAFSPYVIPACMSYSSRLPVSPGSKLRVSGWGKDEKGRFGPRLKTTELPIVGDSDCVRKAPPSLIDFLAEDKFCAGDLNDTAVDTGDSGGGLLYQDPVSSLYYLFGVVSIKSASKSSIALFTNVYHHREWIVKTRNEILKSRKDATIV